MARTGALKKIFEDGFALSPMFNARGTAFGAASGKLKSGAGAEGEAKSGQTSLFGLNPISLERKLMHLKKLIAQGKIALAGNISMGSIKHEMSQPENNGMGVLDMVAHLTAKKMLKAPSMSAAFKPRALAPGM